jgi:hypothetical protein
MLLVGWYESSSGDPMRNIRLNLVNTTLALCGMLLLLCLFEATTETNDSLTGYAFLAGLGLAGILALLHLQRAVSRAGQRMTHLSLAALIVVIILGLVPMCANRHSTVLRRAFLERRVHLYDAMVAKIMANRASLTDRYTDVDKLVGRRGVIARTNEDGSVSIHFYGLVNGGRLDYLRAGYFYHSGRMIPKPGDTNYYTLPGLRKYQFHLTNGWYEY